MQASAWPGRTVPGLTMAFAAEPAAVARVNRIVPHPLRVHIAEPLTRTPPMAEATTSQHPVARRAAAG
jgi:hypothetical protein